MSALPLSREEAQARAQEIKAAAEATRLAVASAKDAAPAPLSHPDDAAMTEAIDAANAAVAASQAILDSLEAARTDIGEQKEQLRTERSRISFAAHGDGSKKAKDRLAGIRNVLAQLDAEAAELDAAIAEAKQRLSAAVAHSQRELMRQRAAHGLSWLETLTDAAKTIDAALGEFVAACQQFEDAARHVAAATGRGPTAEQLHSALRRVLPTGLIPVRKVFDLPIPPRPEQRTASDWASAWAIAARAVLEARIAPGDATGNREKAEAA